MKRRLLQTLITATVMSSLIVTPVLATPQDDVKSLEQKKSQAEAQADSVNKELVNLLVDYDALQSDIKTQGERIDQAESDLKDAEAKEKQQYEDMKLRIKYMYEEGDETFFAALISAKSFSDLINKAEYVQKVHDYDRKMLDEYVETKNQVADLKDNLEEGQAEMEALSDEMGIQKANLEATLTQMRSQIDDFDSQLTQAKAAAAEELKRIEEEQKAAEALAAADQDTQTAQASQEEDPSEDQSSSDMQAASNDKKEDVKPSSNSGNNKKPENTTSDNSKKPENTTSKGDKTETSDNSGSSSNNQSGGGTSSAPSNASLGQQIADMGCQYIGNKYVYGGNSLTGGIDCSGFVQQIHKKFGISTPRSSGAIRSGGKSVSYADKMPGDVICYSGHVAIYIGNNQIVHASNSAPYPKGGIKISSPANYRTVLAVRRYW